ncbi:MAG TPA: prepilin-type N-terminal cleavage/methylation domain-containing protein [Bryobacteraceae bacterium]|nr:prepilin-type N-terminal cleavage/methylation domain-containing protein [Bryobacteraceae bacterium]
MPTSSAGKIRAADAGLTLIEMMVVVLLISLMVGISYPAITSGIDSLRLKAAANGVVSFLDTGLNRAERRQEIVQISISQADNSLEIRSSEPGFYRKMSLPDGISIVQVLPPLAEQAADGQNTARDFLMYPGGTVPPLGVELMNRKNVQRIVRVDPITGVPRLEAPATNE